MDPSQKVQIIYKVVLIITGIIGIFIPIIVSILGVLLVRKSQRKKEEAEAKLAEAQVKLTETQLNKIQKESRDIILETIHEPTLKDISEGYKTLMANFKVQIEALQNENKRIREEFSNDIESLKKEIMLLKTENKELRTALDKTTEENKYLRKRVNNYIKKTDKKINDKILGEQKSA